MKSYDVLIAKEAEVKDPEFVRGLKPNTLICTTRAIYQVQSGTLVQVGVVPKTIQVLQRSARKSASRLTK